MRQLLDDFLRQSWAMKLFVLWGWLAVVIMVSSFSTTAALAYCQQSEEFDPPAVCRVIG